MIGRSWRPLILYARGADGRGGQGGRADLVSRRIRSTCPGEEAPGTGPGTHGETRQGALLRGDREGAWTWGASCPGWGRAGRRKLSAQ
ncbi:MAG: hypothetical protein M0C28_02945 [Candidatus Moduliflexus flocculans]|nr:hypothetical protein [Candidatus Moduliflexus flocculans]